MRTPQTVLFTLLLALGMLPRAMAQSEAAALPYPGRETPPAIDRGEFTESDAPSISVTLALRLPDLNGAEGLLKSLSTPGDAQFHQFLTPEQFAARFAPASADIAKVIATLGKYGLAVQPATATTLKVTGAPAALERTFSVTLHRYEVPRARQRPRLYLSCAP